jgi:hypothetical protein
MSPVESTGVMLSPDNLTNAPDMIVRDILVSLWTCRNTVAPLWSDETGTHQSIMSTLTRIVSTATVFGYGRIIFGMTISTGVSKAVRWSTVRFMATTYWESHRCIERYRNLHKLP